MRASRLGSCIAALASVALLGLGSGGCASGASSMPVAGPATATASRTGARGSAPAASSSATGLAAELLTPADLRGGWSVDPASPEAAMSATCPLLNKTLWDKPLSGGSVAVSLSHGLAGPYLDEELGAGTPGQASEAWRQLVSGTVNCTTFTHSTAQGQSTFTITKTGKLPGYGDASAAFAFSIEIAGGATATGDIVAARSGDSIVVVYIVGIGGVDTSVVEDAVSKAVAKAHT